MKDSDLDKIHEANLRIALQERSEGLCEVCYKAGPLVLHHIWGRSIPRGFKHFPPEIKERWPHVEPGTIIICHGAHGSDERAGRVHAALKHNAAALSALLLLKYWDRMWQGEPYWVWFAGAGPWERWTRDWAILQQIQETFPLWRFLHGDGREGDFEKLEGLMERFLEKEGYMSPLESG